MTENKPTTNTWTRFQRWFAPPVFQGDEELTRQAELLNIILWIVLGVTFLRFLGAFFTGGVSREVSVVAIGLLILLEGGLIWLVRRRQVRIAGMAGIFAFWLAVTALTAFIGGVRGPAVSINLSIIVIAGMVLGGRAALAYGLLSVSAVAAMFVLESYGTLQPNASALSLDAVFIGVTPGFVTVAALMYLYTRRFNESLALVKQGNRELQATRDSLEVRVVERTQELARSAGQNQKRAAQLRISAEIVSAAEERLNLDELLPVVIRLIGERFGLYHATIYLLDEKREYGIRRATYTRGTEAPGGPAWIRVGSKGIIASVLANHGMHNAPDVALDLLYLEDPGLPLTRSELTLPLQTGRQLIGVLDLQSEQPGAFAESEETVLTILAYQIAIAIRNAQSFETQARLAQENQQLLQRSEAAVRELDALNRRLTGKGWQEYVSQHGGQVLVQNAEEPSAPGTPAPALVEAATVGDLVKMKQDGVEMLAAPIMVRGQAIGALGIQDANGVWTADEIAILKETAERVALAVENARLFEQSQQALEITRRAAEREAQLAAINDRLHASTDVKTILQVAAEELLRATGRSRTVVRLNPEYRDA